MDLVFPSFARLLVDVEFIDVTFLETGELESFLYGKWISIIAALQHVNVRHVSASQHSKPVFARVADIVVMINQLILIAVVF